MIQQTTALRKISSLSRKIWVIRGGQGSGKTISILILLINHMMSKPDREILIISAELTKMRLTVIKDFKKVAKAMGVFDSNRFIAETLYKAPNGSFMKFIGLDREDVGKGLRSDIAYFNEVNKCDKESYRQIATRAKRVIMDYNPDAEFFVDEDIIPREDADFLQLTFEDNEQLPKEEREEILLYKEQGYNPDGSVKNPYYANLWEVYGLGNIGSLQGVVFSDWDMVNDMPEVYKWKAYGIDFGFTNDPTACVEVAYSDGELYIREMLYQTGQTSDDLNQSLTDIKRQEMIGDSADPKTIEELRRRGFKIRGAVKGQDSIRAGIDLMQGLKMHVTKDSVNLIKELRGYVWETDKTGKHTGKPIDRLNHCFTGDTLISTKNGLKPIKDVVAGVDEVHTSDGLRAVLHKWENGTKEITEHLLRFDTFSISLESTNDHEVKTDSGWKQISRLSSGDTIYLHSLSAEKITGCTKVKGITVGGLTGCIGLFGNTTKAAFRRAMTFITLMAISITTTLKTLIWFIQYFIKGTRVKRGLEITLNLLRSFTRKESKRLKSGTRAMRVGSGTLNTERGHGSTESIANWFVRSVVMNIRRDTLGYQSTVIKTAKLKHLEIGERRRETVYDLMIDEQHEYFANGVLVHNCIDAVRYCVMAKLKHTGKYSVL